MVAHFRGRVEDTADFLASVTNRDEALVDLCSQFASAFRTGPGTPARAMGGDDLAIQPVSGLPSHENVLQGSRSAPGQRDREVKILIFFFALGEALARINSTAEGYLGHQGPCR